jgi:Rrf2 family transcriptional regulator, cysteine metabolism repressor
MKLSTRVRYGVRAMVELAKQPDNQPISLKQIAKNQGISNKYLEQIAAALKVARLVESIRGAEGGYRLIKPADQITVWDIYCVLDASGEPIDCNRPPCKRIKFCPMKNVWAQMSESITKILGSHTLAQLARQELADQQAK